MTRTQSVVAIIRACVQAEDGEKHRQVIIINKEVGVWKQTVQKPAASDALLNRNWTHHDSCFRGTPESVMRVQRPVALTEATRTSPASALLSSSYPHMFSGRSYAMSPSSPSLQPLVSGAGCARCQLPSHSSATCCSNLLAGVVLPSTTCACLVRAMEPIIFSC